MCLREEAVFGCFVNVCKAFNTVWIEGLSCTLFLEFDIRDRMWLAIKALYTEVRGQMLYSGTLSRNFPYHKSVVRGEYWPCLYAKVILIIY